MIIYSWDGQTQINDGVNFAAWFVGPVLGLPKVDLQYVPRHGARPRIGGIARPALEVLFEVECLAGSANTLRAWFDPEDQTPKALIVTDEGGGNPRYWMGICDGFTPTDTPYIYLVRVGVDDVVQLRSVTATTSHWDITSSGATKVVANGTAGLNTDAYPIITVVPKSYATGANGYRRFLTVRWRSPHASSLYPVDITNAGLDTRIASTHFASATGNDIRLMADGLEGDYWLSGINTATTKLFTNLSWQPAQAATLAVGLGTGAATSLTVNEAITGFPTQGILEIDSELFTYAGKDGGSKRFTGVERAAKGTSAASHLAGAAVTWIQHDIWVEYGSASLSAPTIDNTKQPLFTLASSTNTSWDYDNFYESGAGQGRAASWAFSNTKNTAAYGGNQATTTNPYQELGIRSTVTITKLGLDGAWSLYNPCGIVSANFQNGQFYHGRITWWGGRVRSSVDGATFTTEYSIPTGSNDTWTAWSQNATLTAGSHYVLLALQGDASSVHLMRVEAADVTVGLDSNYTPTVTIGAEQTSYRVQATITNETTGDAIVLDFGTELDRGLKIDTATHEVTALIDDSPQYQALTLLGGARKDILRLQPGNNTLKYEEVGLVDVDVDIEFEQRWRV